MQIDATVAPDGSPVAVYLGLPEGNAADLVHAAIPPRSRILDLGCGVGRIARGLARHGHAVVGVDNEPAMLHELPPGVEGVLADVVQVRLGREFDVVLLASHFLNDVDGVPALLATAREHLAPGGVLAAEVYPPGFEWSTLEGRTRTLGDVDITLERARVDDGIVDAEMLYRVGGQEWRQPFVARLRDEDELRLLLRDAEFAWERWLDREAGWFLARRFTQPPR